MKKLVLALCLIAVLAVPAQAGRRERPSEQDIKDYINDVVVHPDQGQEWEGGIGLDLTVFVDEKQEKKIIPDEVVIETKYDFTNENGSTYLVAKYNLWEKLIKKLKKEKVEE